MEELSELQGRIAAALDRIDAGLGALPRPAADPPPTYAPEDDPEALRAALVQEREVSGQLEERLTSSRTRHETRLAEVEGEVSRLKTLMAEIEADRGRLRALNDALRTASADLREASADGVADAHLVNTALETEIEALEAMRQSDRSELDAILSLLGPVADENEELRDA